MTQEEYNKEIEHIYSQFPSFQVIGSRAFKPGLDSMIKIIRELGNPHLKFRTVHIAGTNGKGSVSSMVASGLMSYNKKVGLYTSPHLIDFRERIKINGEMIPQEYVFSFLTKYKDLFAQEKSSFFEITTALAFKYFAHENVDYAVIECGLGGRLDSTNIIDPDLCIITNIGLDHCQFLGNTLAEIAYEKAGIIMDNVPVVIGERGIPEAGYKQNGIICNKVSETIINKATEHNSKFYIADNIQGMLEDDKDNVYHSAQSLVDSIDMSKMDLKGSYQRKNIRTAALALTCLNHLGYIKDNGTNCTEKTAAAIENTAQRTGLHGRWERLNVNGNDNILVVCDTGHNAHGFAALKEQIENTHKTRGGKLTMVFGVVADKDLDAISHLLPADAEYIAVNAKGERALASNLLKEKLQHFNLNCSQNYTTVKEGIEAALQKAHDNDFIYIGGSTFVVAEAIEMNIFKH